MGEFNKKLVRLICYYCKITDDILQTGTGTLYIVNKKHEYNMEDIDDYCENNEIVNLKSMIKSISGVEDKDIVEVKLKIAETNPKIDSKVYNFINILIDKFLKAGC